MTHRRSIEDLRNRGLADLNSQQRVGLNRFVKDIFSMTSCPSRYEDFQLRIPREEVQQIERIVLSHLAKIDPGML